MEFVEICEEVLGVSPIEINSLEDLPIKYFDNNYEKCRDLLALYGNCYLCDDEVESEIQLILQIYGSDIVVNDEAYRYLEEQALSISRQIPEDDEERKVFGVQTMCYELQNIIKTPISIIESENIDSLPHSQRKQAERIIVKYDKAYTYQNQIFSILELLSWAIQYAEQGIIAEKNLQNIIVKYCSELLWSMSICLYRQEDSYDTFEMRLII